MPLILFPLGLLRRPVLLISLGGLFLSVKGQVDT